MNLGGHSQSTEGKMRSGWQGVRWLHSIADPVDRNLSKLWERVKAGEPGVLQSMGSQRVRHDLATGQQQAQSIAGFMFIKRSSKKSEKASP